MAEAIHSYSDRSKWPFSGQRDHKQLPESDGTFVKNFQELPQSILLTDSLGPWLKKRHPDGRYAIGQDSGIYWRDVEPPLQGVVSPDWYYVADVPPMLDGEYRRSYVMWKERVIPSVVLEFASGNGREEHDKTPFLQSATGTTSKPGKFWVYEQILRIPYYGIFQVRSAELEVYHLGPQGIYQLLSANSRGYYEILPLGVELGVWHGAYQNQVMCWMRWWDRSGHLLLTGAELAEQEKQRADNGWQRAEQEKQRAEQEKQRADSGWQRAEQEKQRTEKLIAQLRALGIEPE